MFTFDKFPAATSHFTASASYLCPTWPKYNLQAWISDSVNSLDPSISIICQGTGLILCGLISQRFSLFIFNHHAHFETGVLRENYELVTLLSEVEEYPRWIMKRGQNSKSKSTSNGSGSSSIRWGLAASSRNSFWGQRLRSYQIQVINRFCGANPCFTVFSKGFPVSRDTARLHISVLLEAGFVIVWVKYWTPCLSLYIRCSFFFFECIYFPQQWNSSK